MTTPRLSRGSRGRFFFYVACLLCLFGLMAIYHNTLTQLDAVKKAHDICQQHQDSLTAQLQVIFDYKNRLEKSLQAEKTEHKQTRTELQKRADSEKSNCDKNTLEANMRYSSLQQQYKLLQTNHDDLKRDFSKMQKDKLTEINALKSKNSELNEQIKLKDRQFEKLKSEYIVVQVEKDKVQKILEKLQTGQSHNESEMNRLLKQNHQLSRELDKFKQINNDNFKVDSNEPNQIVSNIFNNFMPEQKKSNRNFEHEENNGDGIYNINIKTDQNIDKNLLLINAKGQSEHVGDQPGAAELVNPGAGAGVADDTSHVLPQPNLIVSSKKSTTTTTPRSVAAVNASGAAVQPLVQPTSTPLKKPTKETVVQQQNNDNYVLAPPLSFGESKPKKQLPPGVVPPKVDNNLDESKKDSPIEPNRYKNSILESRAGDGHGEVLPVGASVDEAVNNNNLQKPLRKPNINEQQQQIADPNQVDNDAMEVLDSPNNKNIFGALINAGNGPDELFNMLEQKDSLVAPDGGGNVGGNAIEMDEAGIGGGGDKLNGKLVVKHIDQLADGADYDNKDEKGGDLRLEEQEQEGEQEDDVEDDYNDGHLDARQKEPAVRN